MKDWMALAAEFLNSKEGVKQIGEVSEVPTKLTKLSPVDDPSFAQDEKQKQSDSPNEQTKLTNPHSSGVVSVLSVVSKRDPFDDRVLCTDCHNYRYGHCHQHIRAGIGNSSQVGSDLASLPQRCPAFEPKK